MISRVMNSSCSIEVGSLSTSFSHYKEHAAWIYPYRFQCRLKRECRYDHAQLEADGYTVVSGPRITGDGYYESCVRAFEDNLIEITE